MRLFTLIVSALFTAIGIWGIVDGDSSGWSIAGFFGVCLLVAIFEPRLSKARLQCEFRLVMTEDEIACEHPKRKRESIRWNDVNRIWYVTTADGPYLPDEWIFLIGDHDHCSFPTEVSAIHSFWDEMGQRFPGFDYAPVIRGPTVVARDLCWERPGPTHGGTRAEEAAS